MEISKAIFYKQNGHGNFQGPFFYEHKMAMEIAKDTFFTNTKWPWKFPRPLIVTNTKWKFLRPFFASSKWQWKFLSYIFFVGGGLENDHGHFCMFSVLGF